MKIVAGNNTKRYMGILQEMHLKLSSRVSFNPSWSGLFLGLTFLAGYWAHQPFFGLPNFSQVREHCFSSRQRRLHLGWSPRVSPREALLGHAQHTQTSSSEERRWSRQSRPPLFWPGLYFPLVGWHIWPLKWPGDGSRSGGHLTPRQRLQQRWCGLCQASPT